MNLIDYSKAEIPNDGSPFVYGYDDCSAKPITNLPPGARVRLRFTPDTFVTAFVKDSSGIAEYVVLYFKDHWELESHPQRFNRWAE